MIERAVRNGVAGAGRRIGATATCPAALPRGWPAALRLMALLLARGAGRDAAQLQVRELTSHMGPDDWTHFVHLVTRRHRLSPPVSAVAAQAAIPAEAMRAIRAETDQAAVGALRQKVETLRLVDAFASAGIRPTLLKGWALAERLHGSAALRQSRDLDLLVRDAEVAAAVRILGASGYAPVAGEAENATDRAAGEWQFKDVEFERAGQEFTVELHARSNAYRGWPGLGALAASTVSHPIDQSGRSIDVPSPRGDLVYLAIHGVQHMFSRLRWLHDIAVLIDQRSDDDLSGDLAAAAALDAGRFVRVSAGLASAVFGTRWPAGWAPATGLERTAIRLVLDAIGDDGFDDPGRRAAVRRVGLKLLVAQTSAQRMSLLRAAIHVLATGRKGAGE